jgi:minor histocompatibility antigen H13
MTTSVTKGSSFAWNFVSECFSTSKYGIIAYSFALKYAPELVYPVIVSAVLFGFHLAFQYLNVDFVGYLLKIYFSVLSVIALEHQVRLFVQRPCHKLSLQFKKWVDWDLLECESVVLTTITYAISTGVVTQLWFYESWALNNVCAFSMCIFSIQIIGKVYCRSYQSACVFFCGLFAYDVFWVFCTPVMESVVNGFIKHNLPTMLIFPTMDWNIQAETKFGGALGLGDVILPGIFVGLMLRFDQSLGSGSRPYFYFWLTMGGYTGGLIAAGTVAILFESGQPALMYILPSCVLAPSLGAIWRGEWIELWTYADKMHRNC